MQAHKAFQLSPVKWSWRSKLAAMRFLKNREDPRRQAAFDRNARIKLISNLVHDEASIHYRKLWWNIQAGLILYYMLTFGGFIYLDFANAIRYILIVLILLPAIASIAYFIGGAIHHQSHATDHRHKDRWPSRPRTGRVVSIAEQIERSKRLRGAFQNMREYEPILDF